MLAADRIFLEGEEDGWELVIDTDGEPEVRVNVHGLASSGDLRDQLRKILDTLDEWEGGSR